MRGLLLALALALPFGSASGLLAEGRYAEAYEQGMAQGGAAGWLLGAEAANLQATYLARGDAEIALWFGRARAAAVRAAGADPKQAQAHFELARAVGGLLFQENLLGKAAAVGEMRDRLQEALRLRPAYAQAKVALALWHTEVAASGLGWLYGADARRAVPLFEEALRDDPDSVLVRVWYVQLLTRVGQTAQARAQLERALALPARDAAERFEQGLARERLAGLR